MLKLRRAGFDVGAAADDPIEPAAYAAEHAKVPPNTTCLTE